MADLKSETQQHWIRHINSWQCSELSQADYCRQHGLAAKRFHYWKQKLESLGIVPQVSSQTQTHSSLSASRSNIPSKFIPVSVNTTPLASASEGLSIILPNGIELRGVKPDSLSMIKPLLERLL